MIPDVAQPKIEPPDIIIEEKKDLEISPEYEGAGKIFLKAALWDLGVFSEENIKEEQKGYYLIYAKGVKVDLENGKSLIIELPVPIERCIREVADGLINNIVPLIVHKVSDEGLFKSCMEAQPGFKMSKVSIVEQNDHELFEYNEIMEYNRNFSIEDIMYVENYEINTKERSKSLFFTQLIDNINVMEEILNLKGFDSTNAQKHLVTLLIKDGYENKAELQRAAEKLNKMFLRDEQNRLVKIQLSMC